MTTPAAGSYRDTLLEHLGVPQAQRRSLVAQALEYVAGVIAGPALSEPYPALDREAWAEMQCRAGAKRCRCRFCAWEKLNRPRIDDWSRAQALRPSARHPLPFGSIGDALSRYVAWRQDGAALESVTGRQLDRLRDEAASGVRVGSSARADRDPRSAFLAGRAVDVERALVRVYSDVPERRRGTRTWTAIRVLVCAVCEPQWDVEHESERSGLEVADVKGIVREGRRALVVELASRSIIPMPSRPYSLVREIEQRKAERGC